MRIGVKEILLTLCFMGYVAISCAQVNMTEGAKKLATTMMLIDKLYVDEVDDDKLSDDAITALLGKLDPHSNYIKADELKEMNEPLEGNFDGIGISFNMLTDTLYVIEALSGGPSFKVGIRAQDRIIYVNDTLIAGVKMSTRDVMRRLKGPKGTTVDIKVLRYGEKDLLNFRIVRDKIPINSLEAAYMVDKTTGYISLLRFSATTHKEFREAFSRLQKEGMVNLILDLRDNGGGYLSTAIELTNEFLGKDKLIVYTEGAHQPRVTEESASNGVFENGKLVILVNEGSASASEILSGAIQDWDRGVVVGRRTFGKGLVQRQFPLPGGSAMRLSVARYYTPTGRSIQKPYISGDKDSYEKDLIERYNKGEMMSADSIHFPDSLKYTTLVNKRIVYGGGGIMPDYFVPLDTLTTYHRQIWAKGLLQRASFKVTDGHRDELLQKYPSIMDFAKGYSISKEFLNSLVEMANDEKIEYNEKEFNQSKELISLQVKAIIAQTLYEPGSYSRIINEGNPIFNKGLDIIRDDKQYQSLLKGKI